MITAQLEPIRTALRDVLAGHMPYPALIVDGQGILPDVAPGPEYLGFAVPLQLRTPDGDLRLITTLMSVATATDVTLAELRLEAFLPADPATADILRLRAERAAVV